MDIEDLRTDFEEAVKRACIDRKYHANNLENMVARYPEEGGMYRQMWVDSAWIVWQQLPALIQPMLDRLTAAESSVEELEGARALNQIAIKNLIADRDQLRAQLAQQATPAVHTEPTLDFGRIKINYTNMKMEIDESKDWILPNGFVGFTVKGTGISPTPNTGWQLERNAQQTTPAESVHCKTCNDSGEITVGIPHTMADTQEIACPDCSYSSQKVEQVSGGGEPVQWVCEHANNPWPNGGGKRFDTKERAYHYIISEFNVNHYNAVIPIYRDKPSSPNKADVPDVASEEMLSAGIESLELGVKMFPENMTQVISNIWEDMYAAALPPLKDE